MLRLVSLFAVALLAAPAAAQDVTVTPIGHVTVRLTELLAADALKGVRAAVEADMPYFTADIERTYGVKPLAFDRITVAVFQIAPPGERPGVVPVIVRTLRQPADDAAVLKATGGTTVVERGKLRGQPDVRLVESSRRTVLGLTGTAILTAEVPARAEAYPVVADLFATARKLDAEAAAEAKAENAVAVVRADGRSLRAQLADRGRDGVPEPFAPLLAADAGRAVVTLRPGGTVRGRATPPTLAVRGSLTFPDAAKARAAEPAVKAALGLVAGLAEKGKREATDADREGVPMAEAVARMVARAAVAADGPALTLAASADLTPAVSAALAGGPKRLDEAARRAVSTNNLKQIGLAVHNFESANGHLPDNIYAKDGTPLLSWRVHLLPYIEEEKLYNQFKLDEPWDSEHNRKLLDRMPKIFALPGATTKVPGGTFYRSFVGAKGVAIRPLFVEGGAKTTLAGIPDGTSNTLLAVEAAEAVEWTRPTDLPFDPDKPLPKLGGHFTGGFNVVFCDGSVRFVRSAIDPKTLRALVTMNGGEVIGDY
jgi:prepilin-type processing-associated H-X9-DG protein